MHGGAASRGFLVAQNVQETCQRTLQEMLRLHCRSPKEPSNVAKPGFNHEFQHFAKYQRKIVSENYRSAMERYHVGEQSLLAAAAEALGGL